MGPYSVVYLQNPLTLDKAIEIALVMESADRNAKDLQKPLAVHVLKNQSPSRVPGQSSRTDECYRCGGAHLATDCHFKDSECRWCKKKGHIARVCRRKKAAELKKSSSTSHKAAGPTCRATSKGNTPQLGADSLCRDYKHNSS